MTASNTKIFTDSTQRCDHQSPQRLCSHGPNGIVLMDPGMVRWLDKRIEVSSDRESGRGNGFPHVSKLVQVAVAFILLGDNLAFISFDFPSSVSVCRFYYTLRGIITGIRLWKPHSSDLLLELRPLMTSLSTLVTSSVRFTWRGVTREEICFFFLRVTPLGRNSEK